MARPRTFVTTRAPTKRTIIFFSLLLRGIGINTLTHQFTVSLDKQNQNYFGYDFRRYAGSSLGDIYLCFVDTLIASFIFDLWRDVDGALCDKQYRHRSTMAIIICLFHFDFFFFFFIPADLCCYWFLFFSQTHTWRMNHTIALADALPLIDSITKKTFYSNCVWLSFSGIWNHSRNK